MSLSERCIDQSWHHVSCWSGYFNLRLNVCLLKWDTTPWYMYTPTLLTNLLYIHYLHMVWLSSENNLCPFSGSIHIYIYMWCDYLTIWLVTVVGNMYNLCKLHSLICMCSGTRSSCHSLSDCIFLYKYGYETESCFSFTIPVTWNLVVSLSNVLKWI